MRSNCLGNHERERGFIIVFFTKGCVSLSLDLLNTYEYTSLVLLVKTLVLKIT
jgi:hypothetical protein